MSCAVSWKSTKVHHVARSSLAVKTLAFTKGADNACFINQLGDELPLIPPTSQIPTYTNNKSLHDSANTTSQVLNHRLCIALSVIRRETDLQWINKVRLQTVSPRREHHALVR